MTIRHHPDFASLMCCAAGSQPEAFAAVIASHLSVCADCRAEVGRMEQIGVALFDALPPADVVSRAPVVAMRAGEAETAGEVEIDVIEEPRAAQTGDDVRRGDIARGDVPRGDIPRPLVAVLGARLDDLAWSWKGPGIWTHSVPLSEHADGELLLIKVAPGDGIKISRGIFLPNSTSFNKHQASFCCCFRFSPPQPLPKLWTPGRKHSPSLQELPQRQSQPPRWALHPHLPSPCSL